MLWLDAGYRAKDALPVFKYILGAACNANVIVEEAVPVGSRTVVAE